MPLFVPIMIGAGVAVTALYGAKKGVDGVQGTLAAKRTTDEAKARHERHVRILDSSRGHLASRIERLQELRSEKARVTLGRMVELLAALERRGTVRSVEDFERFGGSPEEVKAFAGHLVDARSLTRGGVAAIGAGAGASAAATSVVSAFATASTGTAISGLSGAAANSAILAWLGGGSLAAGGWGMAAGTVVLGGVAVAPAVAIGGVVLAAEAEKARAQATEYSAGVDIAVQRIDTVVKVLRRAERRVRELYWLTGALAGRADTAMDTIELVVESFDDDDERHLEMLRRALLLCGALRRVIDCRVLDDDGQLDATAEALIAQFRALTIPDAEITP